MVAGPPLEDELQFYDGDEIAMACVCRLKSNGHCVASFFALKRRKGTYDFFVSGVDGLRAKQGIDWEKVKVIAADFKSLADDTFRGVWEDVDLSDAKTIPEQVEAMKNAGVPMRLERAGGKQ